MIAPPTQIRRRINRRAFFADLGYRPHPGQWAVHRSTAPRRILASGVRWGKSLCAAAEALAAAMEPSPGSIGWIIAPTYDLADRVYKTVQALALERLRHRVVANKESERKMLIRNMAGGISEIKAKTADNPTSLLGEGLDWCVIDEAARLKPSIWEAHITQRLLDKRGWALLISTPKGKGYFHSLYLRGQGSDPDYESWSQPSWENPHLDREAIEAERDRLPDRVFMQEFGAEFVEGSGSVFRLVGEAATGDFMDPEAGRRYSIGLDLARVEDFTVAIVVDSKGRVCFADRFHKLDWGMQVQRIRAVSERYRRSPITVDSTGVGDPVRESLAAAGCRTVPYILSNKSKAAVINNLALMLEQRQLVLPKRSVFPELIDELEAFEYSVTDHGNVRSGAPSGWHDDCVIALALACWPMRPTRPMPRIFLLPGTPWRNLR